MRTRLGDLLRSIRMKADISLRKMASDLGISPAFLSAVENGKKKIEDVKFETFGCGSAIASSSMATELIKGKSLDEALGLSNQAVAEALDGLPAYKMHCSVLAEEAIKAAVKDYYDKNHIQYDADLFKESCCAHCG